MSVLPNPLDFAFVLPGYYRQSRSLAPYLSIVTDHCDYQLRVV
jgi:hypothetical protein